MGAGSGAMFAAGGCEVTLVARERAKAETALAAIQGIAKSERIADNVHVAIYDEGMDKLLAGADLIFEALAEDMELKRSIFRQVDAARPANALVATVSSGLSIDEMTKGLSAGFRSHFAGIHLYNPPHVMTGVEIIPHADMPAAVVEGLRELLTVRFGRNAIVCDDLAAFVGNRVGFKVINEVAQLAEKHGVELMDTLVGPYTGRAMSPLATADLVGWDVHQAIVDNIVANTSDEAKATFVFPEYMKALMEKGHLGDKTPEMGGFYRKVIVDGKTASEVLDPATRTYRPASKVSVPFVEEIKDLHHRGRYREGVNRFMEAPGPEADIARKVILGYVSYGLNRVGAGEPAHDYRDVDRIMSAGFNWIPPSALVDYIGLQRTIQLLDRYGLKRPALLDAASRGDIPTPLFDLPFVTASRYFAG
jgi:3-hydroxyacyl-CoA dehydrogenase